MQKKLLFISVLGLSLSWVAFSVQAEDDVYVDLSVLNELQSPSTASQPLFPTVAKKTVKKAAPAKKVVKKAVKAPEPVVKEAEPEIKKAPEPVVAEPVEADAIDITVKKPEIIVSRPSELSGPAEAKTVDALRQAINHNSDKPQSETLPAAPAVSEAPAPAVNTVPADAEKVSAVEMTPAVAMTPLGNTEPEAAVSEAKPVETEISKRPEPKAAVDVQPEVPEGNTLSAALKYPADEYELTDADKQQIDRIIATFADAKANKIAITAYNLDDGKDVFYRKRLSLNRAIEVRSYLLNKGYKNYSIKVVNIPAGDERENTVELSELK